MLTCIIISSLMLWSIQGLDVYVKPLSSSLCPGSPCMDFLSYSDRKDEYFKDDNVFHFLPGEHVLPENPVTISHITNITFLGLQHPVISCSSGVGGIIFQLCLNVQVSGITISNCSITSISEMKINSSLAIHSVYRAQLSDVTILNGNCNGLIVSLVSSISISNSVFANNSLATNVSSANILVINSLSISLRNTDVISGYSDGLFVMLHELKLGSNILIVSSRFIENGLRNIVFVFIDSCNYNVSIEDAVCSNSKRGMGLEFYQQYNCGLYNVNSSTSISRSVFASNAGIGFALYWHTEQSGSLIISSCSFINNTGIGNSAIVLEQLSAVNSVGLSVKMYEVIVHGNEVFESNGVTTSIKGIRDILISNCTFSNNKGTGIAIADSLVIFSGSSYFVNNVGINGGGMLIMQLGLIYLEQKALLHFINNHALNFGGAIRIFQDPFWATNSDMKYQARVNCFYQLSAKSLDGVKYFYFENNSANISGLDIYGGVTNECISIANSTNIPSTATTLFEHNLFLNISTFSSQTGHSISSISSDAVQVCFCNNWQTPDCSRVVEKYMIFPTDLVTFSVAAVNHKNEFSPGIIKMVVENNPTQSVLVQSSLSNCTALRQSENIKQNNTIITFTLYTIKPFKHRSNKLKVVIDVKPCNIGFKLSAETGICECELPISSLSRCFESNGGIVEAADKIWIGIDDQLNCIVLDDCPFGFCKPSRVNITINDSDKQCTLNRKGILCGSCSTSFSLVLGSNDCQRCYNDEYVLYIVPFILAGLGLVLFLLVLNLTVSVGTVNGLILFANVIKIYEPYLPVQHVPFLHQFIAWINLDLGMESCFIVGMGPCLKAGLQFVFPLYLIVIASVLHSISCFFPNVFKYFSAKPLSVLSTVLILSYSKMLNAVATIYVPNMVKCIDGSNVQLLWQFDPQTTFLTECHLILFIIATFITTIFLLPYTVFLVFFPLLELLCTKYNLVCKSHILKLKPLIDTYGEPNTEYARYWSGLYLLMRVVLLILVQFYRSISVDVLLSMSVFSIFLLSAGVIYKTKIHLLDTLFFFGLLVFGYFSSGSMEPIALYPYVFLIASSFFIFCGIVGFHIYHLLSGKCKCKWNRPKFHLRRCCQYSNIMFKNDSSNIVSASQESLLNEGL